MKLLPIPCAMAFVGIWIEKGMGLIVPGFIPSPIGEVTEYYPTFVEWLMTLGIWAFGFFILTILLKGAIGILLGDVQWRRAPARPRRRSEVTTMKRILPFPRRCWPCARRAAVGVAQDKPAAARRSRAAAEDKEVICFESRKGATEVTKREIKPGLPNVKCSPTTGAALWYGDPYDGTVPMGKMPQLDECPTAWRS